MKSYADVAGTKMERMDDGMMAPSLFEGLGEVLPVPGLVEMIVLVKSLFFSW